MSRIAWALSALLCACSAADAPPGEECDNYGVEAAWPPVQRTCRCDWSFVWDAGVNWPCGEPVNCHRLTDCSAMPTEWICGGAKVSVDEDTMTIETATCLARYPITRFSR